MQSTAGAEIEIWNLKSRFEHSTYYFGGKTHMITDSSHEPYLASVQVSWILLSIFVGSDVYDGLLMSREVWSHDCAWSKIQETWSEIWNWEFEKLQVRLPIRAYCTAMMFCILVDWERRVMKIIFQHRCCSSVVKMSEIIWIDDKIIDTLFGGVRLSLSLIAQSFYSTQVALSKNFSMKDKWYAGHMMNSIIYRWHHLAQLRSWYVHPHFMYSGFLSFVTRWCA